MCKEVEDKQKRKVLRLSMRWAGSESCRTACPLYWLVQTANSLQRILKGRIDSYKQKSMADDLALQQCRWQYRNWVSKVDHRIRIFSCAGVTQDKGSVIPTGKSKLHHPQNGFQDWLSPTSGSLESLKTILACFSTLWSHYSCFMEILKD